MRRAYPAQSMHVIELKMSVPAYSQNKGCVVAVIEPSERVEPETWHERSTACFAASSTAEVNTQVSSASAFGKYTWRQVNQAS